MATPPRDLRSTALTLIQAANDLLQEEQTILSSAEECDYFRNIYRSSRNAPVQLSSIRKQDPITIYPIELVPAIPQPPQIVAPQETALPVQPAVLPPQKVNAAAAIESPPISTPTPTNIELNDLQKLICTIIPHFPYVKEIPNDAKAQQIAQRWKTKNQSSPISLLCLHEPPSQQKFLINLANALDVVFGPAKLIHAETIEKENQWETFLSVADLKLVIICDYALWQMPHLLQFYREIPNQTQRFLLNKPLMLLPDLTLYLKDPQLKRSLWKALCQKIGSL